MAPEVIELAGATTASDIWSVGCTVIELLDGRPPYHTLDPMPALFRIVNDDHPPLPNTASASVRDFLLQCFQKDPNLRVSAKKLLKHPWIANAKPRPTPTKIAPMRHHALSSSGHNATISQFDDAIKSVKQWNAALSHPRRHRVRGSSRAVHPRRLRVIRRSVALLTKKTSQDLRLNKTDHKGLVHQTGLSRTIGDDDFLADDLSDLTLRTKRPQLLNLPKPPPTRP